MASMAGCLVAASVLAESLCPDEERKAFAFAFPLALYEEMGHVFIDLTDEFYFKGKTNLMRKCPVQIIQLTFNL